jgi:hypothetical protein
MTDNTDQKKEIEVTLSDNKTVVKFNLNQPDTLYDAIITHIIIPYYKLTNDWNETIRRGITEIDVLRRVYEFPKTDFRLELLKKLHKKLGKEIDSLKGLDKIEILFLNMEDYIQDIDDLMKTRVPREEKAHSIGDMISSLNTFEVSELLLYYIEKSLKK